MKEKVFLLLLCIVVNVSALGQNVRILFRYDDYGIENDKVSLGVFRLFREYEMPLLVGVIPAIKGVNNFRLNNSVTNDKSKKSILNEMLQDSNFVIGMHGYDHRNNSKSALSSEFTGLSYNEQKEKIERSQKMIMQKFGKKSEIFIPPWNTYDAITVKALIESGFKLISAARYNFPELASDNSMLFLPYTITFNDFIKKYTRIVDNSVTDPLLVVMMHQYDFIEQNPERGTISVDSLEGILYKLAQNPNVRVLSFNDVIGKEDLSYERLLHNQIPAFMLPDLVSYNFPGYLSADEKGKYLLYFAKPLFFLMMFLLLSYIFVNLFFKFISTSLNFGKLIYMSIITVILLNASYFILGFKFSFYYVLLALFSLIVTLFSVIYINDKSY